MAENSTTHFSNRDLFKYITKEKRDVADIYIYSILSGLVQLSIPLGIQAIISFAMGSTMVTSLYLLIGFVVLGTFFAGLFQIRVMQIIEKIQQKIFVEYALAFAEKLPKVNLATTKKYFLPELANRFFDAPNLQKGISKLLLVIPTALIQILFGILLLSFYHPWFLGFGATILVIVVFIFKFTMSSGIESSIMESNKKYDVASWLEDVAASVKTFKINAKANSHLIEADDRVVSYLKHRTIHFKVLLLQYWTIVGFKMLITLLMLAIGTYLLVNQELNVGAFIATEIVVLSILGAVEKLIKSIESYYDVITSLAKLSKVTNLPEEPTADIELESTSEGMEVVLDDISFHFNDKRLILNNLDLKLPKNSLTVINGKSGTGKSLLINLLAGFYDPSAGTILIDNIPMKNLNKDSFRNLTGIYLEDMGVIKGSLLENIILGKESIGIDDVIKLSQAWGIQNFSADFSNGLQTPLSETDTELSFSSRKKILLLRAMLGKKRLLLLENPTDGLSEEFAAKLVDYLVKIKENTTVVIVSQSKELIARADYTFDLYNGTVVQV
jgi:ATP-binding cassette subfamily B protein